MARPAVTTALGELDPLLFFLSQVTTFGTKVLGTASCSTSSAALRRLKVISLQPRDRRLTGLAFDEVVDAAELTGLIVGEKSPSVVDPHAASRTVARDAPAVGRARVEAEQRGYLTHQFAKVSHDATPAPPLQPHDHHSAAFSSGSISPARVISAARIVIGTCVGAPLAETNPSA